MNLRPQIVIDLGSSNITGAHDDNVVTLPSQAIRNTKTGEIVDVGSRAKERSNLELPLKRVFAVREGRLVDYEVAQRVIGEVIDRLLSWWTLLRPLVFVAVSSPATVAEIKQIKEAARVAGANSVYTAPSIVLAAFGSGVSPESPTGVLVLDIGAGHTEAAVIVRGSRITSNTVTVGGERLIRDIVSHVDDAYGYSLSLSQAEYLLSEIGTAVPQDDPSTQTVTDQVTGKEVTVSANDIAAGISNSLKQIADSIHEIMQQTSAALLTDISQSGVIISGGVGSLDYIDTYFKRRLSVPVTVTESPESAVARGGRVAWSEVTEHPQYPRIVQLG